MTLTLALASVVGILFGITIKFLPCAIFAGRAIVPADPKPVSRYGAIRLIVPRWYDWLTKAWPCGLVVFCIVGTLQQWWLGAAAVLWFLIIATVVQACLPTEVTWYLRIMARSTARRSAKYRRQGDLSNAEMTETFVARLEVLMERTRASTMLIPKPPEAKGTPWASWRGDS